jgi:hypothetical protein
MENLGPKQILNLELTTEDTESTEKKKVNMRDEG